MPPRLSSWVREEQRYSSLPEETQGERLVFSEVRTGEER